ncbi:MAG: single-stranded DNA-binding protein [Actinomycetota bacterium]|nr:single-stranded DNA-binding protein [Actinomycetota bacterium]
MAKAKTPAPVEPTSEQIARTPDENSVRLRGRLTADGELRNSGDGLAIAKFRVATNTGKAAEYHSVVCFDKLGEDAVETLKKGQAVRVEGRLHTSQWEAKDGSGKRSKTEVIASAITAA